MAAKALWGYPPRWLDQWRGLLTVTPAYIETNEVFVAQHQDALVGFCAFQDLEPFWDLDHLWVRPDYVRRGVGRRLFQHALRVVLRLRRAPIRIESDPNAEGFYVRMGARRIGVVDATTDGVPRSLPVLEWIPRSGNSI